MKKRARLLSAVCLLIALVVSWLVPGDAGLAFAEDGLVCLQILAINDLHGHIEQTEYLDGRPVGGVAYLATYMLEREADAVNTLRVHAGDMIGASPPISGLLQDQPTIEVLSFMGFDVGVPETMNSMRESPSYRPSVEGFMKFRAISLAARFLSGSQI